MTNYIVPPEGQIEILEKSVTERLDQKHKENFDIEVESLFNKL